MTHCCTKRKVCILIKSFFNIRQQMWETFRWFPAWREKWTTMLVTVRSLLHANGQLCKVPRHHDMEGVICSKICRSSLRPKNKASKTVGVLQRNSWSAETFGGGGGGGGGGCISYLCPFSGMCTPTLLSAFEYIWVIEQSLKWCNCNCNTSWKGLAT